MASAVIIGGGVVGCSIAYHLVRRGLHDVVVLERETVGSGTTSKAAGGIRVQFSSETEIRFSLESIRVFERFQEEFGVDPGYRKIGYLYLLSEERHLREFEKRIALQRTLGADVRVLTPADAQKLVPADAHRRQCRGARGGARRTARRAGASGAPAAAPHLLHRALPRDPGPGAPHE